MLTKKDYVAIAGIIKEQRTFADTSDELNRIDGIAMGLAVYLAADRPEFDRVKFLDACGTC